MKTMAAIGIAFACLSAAGNLARAEWFGLDWLSSSIITEQDREIMRSAVQQKLHGKRIDTVVPWRNPGSGHSGNVTLISTLTRQGMPCERIEYYIASAKPGEHPERYVFNSCRLPDGTWKLAD